MRKAVLFIAASLDGCITDCRGGVGWRKDRMMMKPQTGKDIWICGGSNVVRQLGC